MASVYRDFAPAVNSFLSEGLAAATDGRYHRAHVDPRTLRVSLLVPETGLVVTDPPVSHGTRTLMYVLMRVGLAQHMSAIGEPVPANTRRPVCRRRFAASGADDGLPPRAHGPRASALLHERPGSTAVVRIQRNRT